MADSQHNTQASATIDSGDQATEASTSSKLDLTGLSNVFVLPTYLSTSELHAVEDEISNRGGTLTYDIKESNIVFGNISKERRAKFELQCGKVCFEEIHGEKRDLSLSSPINSRSGSPARKRRALAYGESKAKTEDTGDDTDDPSTGSETQDVTEDEENLAAKPMSQLSISQGLISPTMGSPDTVEADEPLPFAAEDFAGKVKVIKLDWLKASLVAGRPEPFEPYTLYEARLLPLPGVVTTSQPAFKPNDAAFPATATTQTPTLRQDVSQAIIERAKAEVKPSVIRAYRRDRVKDAANRDFIGRSFTSSSNAASQSFNQISPPHLLQQTTSEHDEAINNPLPPMPDWVLQDRFYSCERSTTSPSPNDPFIDLLKRIRLARTLTADDIGVRAYSTSIASLAAYHYPLSSPREVLVLPGCDQKIAHLFHEYHTTGSLQAIKDFESDPAMQVLRTFYEIWGVGAATAREFYYDKKWKDLDDIVEQGWTTLSRVQQIGVKYYDEFQLKIPRSESESIASIITSHANRCVLPPEQGGIESVIVGGYRRGKTESGDVDIILSHRSEAQTSGLVDRVVKSLEREGWIAHTLTLNLTSTKRQQQPLPLASLTQGGHGFDTLDKALVVWQNPYWPTQTSDLAADPAAKNPNPHRRVDIIVSPWRTVGCAVQGWTSGTTFNRDLRRYAKKVKGWKFDSSGVRVRGTGAWVDLEKWRDEKTRCQTPEEAERRVFEGFGLVWREPWERCTE